MNHKSSPPIRSRGYAKYSWSRCSHFPDSPPPKSLAGTAGPARKLWA